MNKKKRYNILFRLQNNQPNPTIGLTYHSSFEFLIAVLLSSKTTDINVNKVTNKLFKIANTPKSMLEIGLEIIKNYIKPIGLFNNKAKNIINTCKIIYEKYHGMIPENKEDLKKLPGIGSKSANMILNVIFKLPIIAVDTHVFRVSNRTHFAKGKNVKTVEKKLSSLVPINFKVNFHHWFVSLGKYTCISKKPKCISCLILDLCEYNKKHYL